MGLRWSTRKHRTLYWISDINFANITGYYLVKHKNLKIKVKGNIATHHADYSLISASIWDKIFQTVYDGSYLEQIMDKLKERTVNTREKVEITINDKEFIFHIYSYAGLMKELKDFKYFDDVGKMIPSMIIQ